MPQKTLSEMADTGYENMSEESGYVLHELKLAMRKVSERIEDNATRAELQAVWQTVEKQFATRSELLALRKFLNQHLDTYDFAAMKQALNMLANCKDQFDIQREEITIASADLLTMNATPVTLLGAPPAGKFIDLVHIELFMGYNSAVYAVDAGEDLSISYTTAGEIIKFTSAGLFDQASDQRRAGAPTSFDVPVGVAEAIQASILVGELAGGDSDLKIRCDYRILDALV